MSAVRIDFTQLQIAITNLNLSATQTRSYGEALKNDNIGLLDGIAGGCSGNVASARDAISRKSTQLTGDGGLADQFSTLANTLTTFGENVRTADAGLASVIEAHAETAEEVMGIECSRLEEFWYGLSAGVKSFLNESEFGQMINNAYRNVSDWFAEKWDDFKSWYAFDGGQFWCNIGLAVIGIAAAIFTICTAGVGFLAFVAVVGALCTIADGLATIYSNVKAIGSDDTDPAWARRMGDNKSISDFASDLEASGEGNSLLTGFGKMIDFTSTVCAIIDFADFSTKTFTKFTGRETMFQKYFGSSGMIDSFFINMSDTSTRKFNAMTRQWEIFDSSGNPVLNDRGEIKVVDFKTLNGDNKGVKFDLNKGLRELLGNNADGLREIGNSFKYDFSTRTTSITNRVDMIVDNYRALDRVGVGTVGKLKMLLGECTTSAGDAFKDGFHSYFKGTSNWKQGGARIWQDVSSTLGIKGMQNDYKALPYRRWQDFKVGNYKVGAAIGDAAFVGSEIKKGLDVIEKISDLLNGNITDVLQTTKKFDKAFGGFFAPENG